MRIFDGPRNRPVLLALRTLKLGDLLVAVPAIRGLRRAFPEHELVLAMPGWLEPIVALTDADALLPAKGLDDPLPLAPGLVDVAVNLHGSGGESAALVSALRARHVLRHRRPGEEGPADPEAAPPVWRDGLLERARWVRLVAAFGVEADPDDVAIRRPDAAPVVARAAVVHVGAFYGARQWPVERFAAVARGLAERGLDVVVTGGGADVERARAVAEGAGLPGCAVLAGVLDLAQSAAVVADARVVVSADTGVAHLASAYAVPSVVLFGPAPPEEWGPPPGPHVVLTDASVRRGEAFSAEPDPAILAVTAEGVLAAVDGLAVVEREG